MDSISGRPRVLMSVLAACGLASSFDLPRLDPRAVIPSTRQRMVRRISGRGYSMRASIAGSLRAFSRGKQDFRVGAWSGDGVPSALKVKERKPRTR